MKCRFLFVMLLLVPSLLAQQPDASQAVSNPREMLGMMQIDNSLLSQFIDDRPVEGNEQEPLFRILFRLPAFAQVDIDQWTTPVGNVKALHASCDDRRFEFLDLRGDVEQIENQRVIPELQKRLGFSEYFRLTIAHDQTRSIVYVQTLPKAWMPALAGGTKIHEPVRIQGLLLKKEMILRETWLVFAAARIQWHPNGASKELGVTDDQVLLSGMGLDIGQLAEIQQRAAMAGGDRESFYQTLAAVHHAETTQLAKLGRKSFDIARMIRTPKQVVGELYTLTGTARRAIRIEVGDPDIRKRFGIDHYFEIEVFMPMQKAVRFVDENANARVFQDYPFVICVPELPENMPLGDDIRMPVNVSGFFLKLWAYKTEFMAEVKTRDAKTARQLSPLLIGPTVIPVADPAPQESSMSMVIACLFVASLLAIWLLLWRASIQDGHRSRQLFQKNLPTDTSFDNLSASE